MSSTLNSIMLILRNVLDSSFNIANVDAVADVVTQLETFPMTMIQLQDTRIGQLLQTIRHKVAPPLQKRIRFIIKAWQKLLLPEFSAQSVIPLKCGEQSLPVSRSSSCLLPDGQKSNGTSFRSTHSNCSKTVAQTLASPSPGAPCSSPCSRPLKRTHSSPIKSADSVNNQASEMLHPSKSGLDEHSPVIPTKRLKTYSSQVNLSALPSTNSSLVNGNQHTNASVKVVPRLPEKSLALSQLKPNSSPAPAKLTVSVATKKNNKTGAKVSTRLAKVKSTVELVQAASDCLDSATMDRILTNRICKEADPPRPSVVPHLTKSRTSKSTGASTVQPGSLNRIASRPTVRTPSVLPRGTPTTALLDNVNKCALPRISTDIIAPTEQTSDSVSSEPSGVPGRVSTVADTDSDTQNAAKHSGSGARRKKHKHRHKRHATAETGERLSLVQTFPPITNHLDDWPNLPPLPKYIDWHSLDRGVDAQATTGKTVNDLLFGLWSGVNCTLDDLGHARSLSDLYSLTVDDQYLHVLPWIDMVGAKRQFFPSSAATCTSQELDELISLPDPW